MAISATKIRITMTNVTFDQPLIQFEMSVKKFPKSDIKLLLCSHRL